MFTFYDLKVLEGKEEQIVVKGSLKIFNEFYDYFLIFLYLMSVVIRSEKKDSKHSADTNKVPSGLKNIWKMSIT